MERANGEQVSKRQHPDQAAVADHWCAGHADPLQPAGGHVRRGIDLQDQHVSVHGLSHGAQQAVQQMALVEGRLNGHDASL